MFSYTDWGPAAAWRTTTLTNDAFWALGRSPTVLAQLPGWRLSQCRPDSMHVVNLGLAHLLIGNALWYFATRCLHTMLPVDGIAQLPAGASMSDRLWDLQLRFKAWLRVRKLQCSIRRFTVAALHREKSTHVCMFLCKAAQAPPLVGWLSELASDFAAVSNDPHAGVVAGCLWGMATYFDVLKSGGRFLTNDECHRLDEAGHAFLYLYSELTRASHDALWRITPKFHQFQHLVLDALEDKCNPRFFTCFGDEDMVGKMLTLSRTGHAHVPQDHVVTMYAIGAKQRFLAPP